MGLAKRRTRGALNAIKSLLKAKRARGSSKAPSEKQVIQVEISKLKAALLSARVHLMDEIDQTWTIAEAAGEIPPERRTQLRLAGTHKVRTGADVSRGVCDLGGMI